jgi:hypothetical protein
MPTLASSSLWGANPFTAWALLAALCALLLLGQIMLFWVVARGRPGLYWQSFCLIGPMLGLLWCGGVALWAWFQRDSICLSQVCSILSQLEDPPRILHANQIGWLTFFVALLAGVVGEIGLVRRPRSADVPPRPT